MILRHFPARWPALLFLVIFAGLGLVACQANEEIAWATVSAPPVDRTDAPEETSTPDVGSTAAPSPTVTDGPTLVLRGQVIEFWHPWQGDLARRVEEAVVQFNLTNEWGIKVNLKPFYSSGALIDGVNAGLKDKAGGLPQVVAAPGVQLAIWSELDNAVIDLAPYIAHSRYGFKEEEIAAFQETFWAQGKSGDRQVAIPALQNARVLFYNESWAKELGFYGPPKTPSEFRTQACAAAQKNNTSRVLEKFGTGGWIIDTDPITTLSWFAVFGAQPIPESPGMPYSFKGKEAEDTFSFLRGLLDNGCAWLAKNPTPYEYFARRMALFYTGNLEDIAIQSRWNAKFKNEDSWRVLPFMSKDGKPVVISEGDAYAVFHSEPETEMAAWLFMRWMLNPKVAVKLVQAMPSLPVSTSQADQLKDMQTRSPWNMIFQLAGPAQAAPSLASWPEARRFVEDAAWQVFHVPAENVPQILPELDQVIQNLSAK